MTGTKVTGSVSKENNKLNKKTRMDMVQDMMETLIEMQEAQVDEMNKEHGDTFGQSHRESIEVEYGRVDGDGQYCETDEKEAECVCAAAWTSKCGWSAETDDFEKHGKVLAWSSEPYYYESVKSGDADLDKDYCFELARTDALDILEIRMRMDTEEMYAVCSQIADSKDKPV